MVWVVASTGLMLRAYVGPEALARSVLAFDPANLWMHSDAAWHHTLRTALAAQIHIAAPAGCPVWAQRFVQAYEVALCAAWTGWAPLYAGWVASRNGFKQNPITHGSAAWGTRKQASRAGMLYSQTGEPKLLLGAFASAAGRPNAFYQVDSHVLTCASTGSGKGIGAVIYNLLTYRGSAFVLDIKGENFAVTAEARVRLGQQVAFIDPFGLSGRPSHRINWLTHINPATAEGVSDAAILADSLIVSRTHGDSHFDDSAAYLLQGLILYAASMPPKERSMALVRRLVTDTAQLHDTLTELAAFEDPKLENIARVARTFLAKEERERSSVLSTAVRHTRFLDDPRLTDTMGQDDLSFADLKKGPLTIYLMLPPDKLAASQSYVRALVGLALRAMVQTPGRPAHSVLFLLDEFAQLGRFRPVEEAIAIMRGYHVRIWMFFQDLSQLKTTYRNWESFVANCSLQFFGVQDQGTAEYVSTMLGRKTEQNNNSTMTQRTSVAQQASGTQSATTSWSARPLLTPDEVCLLSQDEVIVRAVAQRPQRLRRLNYLKDPSVRKDAKINPMY